MKLFVIAALIAVAAAGRLEHLERSYLPPDSNSIIAARSSSGSNPHSSFGNSGAFGAAGAGLQGRSAGAAFGGATSNQYLPPNYGSSGSNGQQFGGSSHGFGAQNFRSQQYSAGSQFGSAQGRNSQYGSSQGQNAQYGSPQGRSSQFGSPSYQSQYGQQSAATSRQYLAPHAGSYQQTPQQPFDEQTGYHY